MRCEYRISTGEAYKLKARLNLHGGKKEHGVSFCETYTSVVSWIMICFFLMLILLNGWCSWQVAFMLASLQAAIKCPLYIEMPQGFKVPRSPKTHCLELKKNLYGQKQACRVWTKYLHDGPIAKGFIQSNR
jgi:hypothetical protein